MSQPEESANFFRLIRLLVDTGSDVLRDLLLQIIYPESLDKFLQRNINIINTGKQRKLLLQDQYDLLTNIPAVHPEEIDITLLCWIFRNICNISPTNGWQIPPGATDISLGDDIYRLRNMRNNIISHLTTTQVPSADFKKLWVQTSDIITRLAQYGSPQIQQNISGIIQSIRSEALDPESQTLKRPETLVKSKNHDNLLSLKLEHDYQLRTHAEELQQHAGLLKTHGDQLEEQRDQLEQQSQYNTIDTGLSAHRLPAEILRMDSKSVKLFKKALEDGQERIFNIRIMVVGPFGVGKTAFTKRLLCQDVDINERNSTDGIDVHVGKCKVSLKTMDWTVDPVGTTNDNALKRLARILGSTSKSNTDETISQSLDDNQALQKNTITVSQQEEIRTSKSDKDIVEGETVEQTVKKIQNSAGDTMNSPQYQEDLLMKDLKEIAEAGDIDEDGDNATVSIWDFGGQFVFYTTHQMFLSSRAIYILVFNLNQHIDDLVTDDVPYFDCSGARSHKIEEFIDIWLNSIHGHSTKNDKEPPVLLVGTHADKLKPDQREEQVEAMFDAIRNRFAGTDASLHFIDEDFGLSNVTEDPKLSNLKQKIIEVAKIQGHWGELKPAKWIPVEQLLEGLRRSGVEILSRARLEELNSKLPVPISSDEELALFLRFQHDVANIMYYSLPELRDKIVLSPQFLVNALKSLITAESFVKKKPDVLKSWLQFSKHGLLKPNLLDAVWKNGKNTRSFEENRDHILALMEHLNIIARPVTFAGNDEPCDCNITQEQDYFLAPCMLKELPPLSFFQYEKPFNFTPYLCLELDNKMFPGTIFNRLLCACISRWPIAQKESNYLIYCGCGQFEVDRQHRLTLLFTSNIIGLRIVRFCSTGDPNGTVCKEVYSVVKQILRRIGDGLSLKINYKEFVKCPLGSQNSFECRHAVEKLRDNDDEFPCHGHAKKTSMLSPSDLLKFWFDSKEFDQVQRSSDCLKTSITDDNELRHNSVHSLQDPPAPVSIAVSAAPANSHAFKKSTDDTLDQHTLNELTKKMKSVGALVCHQQQIATVFRAGSKFVVTAAHSVSAFGESMSQQLFDNPNLVISFQNPTEPNENPSSSDHMIKRIAYYNTEYDTAVLELTDPDKLPPKLTLLHLDRPNIQVQLVHIIGYGHEYNKKTLDPKCKVISPMDPLLSEAKTWLQNEKDAIADFVQPRMQLTPEQWGYHGCDQKEKIIFNCYLEKGSSGAPILAFYNPFELFVGGMVTNGLPYCFWTLTPDGQSRFPNKYRFEMGTKMSAIYAKMNESDPNLAYDLFQQH